MAVSDRSKVYDSGRFYSNTRVKRQQMLKNYNKNMAVSDSIKPYGSGLLYSNTSVNDKITSF